MMRSLLRAREALLVARGPSVNANGVLSRRAGLNGSARGEIGGTTHLLYHMAVRSFIASRGTLGSSYFPSTPSGASDLLQRRKRDAGFDSVQKRGIVHIPILGLLTPKVLAALAVKKSVVVAVLHKYGIKGTFDILRATNEQLGTQLGPASYPPAAKLAVKAGLDALETTIHKMDPKDQTDIIYKWVSSLDPRLLVESFKTYVSTSPTPGPNDTYEETKETLEEVRLIKELSAQHPDIAQNYHIVLIRRDPDDGTTGKTGGASSSKASPT